MTEHKEKPLETDINTINEEEVLNLLYDINGEVIE